mgnify:CR=1 FL=1
MYFIKDGGPPIRISQHSDTSIVSPIKLLINHKFEPYVSIFICLVYKRLYI